MSVATRSKQHLSDDGVWRACRASVKPCTLEQHREIDLAALRKSAVREEAQLVPFKLLGEGEPDYYYASDGTERMAPAGCSGKWCPGCKRYLTREQVAAQGERDLHKCVACEKVSLISEMPTDLRADQLRFAEDEAVREASWFHISQREDWDAGTKADEVVTHLGSKEAAMERMSHLLSRRPDKGKPFYLHEVRLVATASVKPGIWHDQVSWPEGVGEATSDDEPGVDGGQVLRYMNFYEGPGTVSLMADPSTYELVTSVQIPDRA